ncbi:hypothetical protein CNMCM6936_002900 [Aspergillus lentulus]|nr:hypothetical protein CNMCM6936_002900 [Aspergillus lentulus]
MSKILVSLLASLAVAQQLDGIVLPLELLGLSEPCFEAVNTTISSCPFSLALYTGIEDASFERLNRTQLDLLCQSSCRKDLQSLRTTVQKACTASTDVMMPGATAYPATFLVDRYLYSSGLSCLTEPSTGEYCDVVTASWANQTEYTAAQNCSPCQLSLQKLQLSSPFGYSDDDAAEFASLIASCSAITYTYATPTAYAVNATTSTPTTTPTCTGGSYQVQADDTCVSISGAVNVSTYDLISSNALDLACNSLSEGKTLCLPPTCTTHQLDMPDTCDSLTASLNITLAQLLAWNPVINSGCSNLATWRGWFLCASSPMGTVPIRQGSAPTTAAPVPTNAQGQSNTNCAEWYLVQSGDYCSSISVKFGISLNDFYFLNPQVDVNCSNLWLNTSYCVRAVGNIATYSGYPVTTPSYTFTKPPSTTAFTPVAVATPPLKPKAPGTWTNCTFYENAFNAKIVNYESLNSCRSWSINSGSTVEQLIHWNPSLDPQNCVLDPAYSYCLISGEPKVTEYFPHDYCFSANMSLIPSTSVQPPACSCYIQLRAQDQSLFNCSMFPSLFNVTVPEVTSMNPWLGTDCDKNLWSVLSSDGYLQLCMQQGQRNVTTSTVPSTTATATATATATTSSPVATPPAPTQPGAAVNCTKWHTVVSGDGCQAIAAQYGISLANFYLWNPGVGSDCSTLWLGYAVCVGV